MSTDSSTEQDLMSSTIKLDKMPPVINKEDVESKDKQLEQDEKYIRRIIETDCRDIFDDQSDDYIEIRPNGNKLINNVWKQMLNDKSIIVNGYKVLSIEKIDITDQMAYAIYVIYQKTTYNNIQDDQVVFVCTSIFKKDQNNQWKMILTQKSKPRTSSEPLPTL